MYFPKVFGQSDRGVFTIASGSFVTNIAIVYAWEMAISMPIDPLVVGVNRKSGYLDLWDRGGRLSAP
jgi:hypothetical protein